MTPALAAPLFLASIALMLLASAVVVVPYIWSQLRQRPT